MDGHRRARRADRVRKRNKELDNLYSIGLVLERLAARQAAQYITTDALDALEEWNEQMKSQRLEDDEGAP